MFKISRHENTINQRTQRSKWRTECDSVQHRRNAVLVLKVVVMDERLECPFRHNVLEISRSIHDGDLCSESLCNTQVPSFPGDMRISITGSNPVLSTNLNKKKS